MQHLRLDRDVERGDRLVGDDQLGLDRERAGDADALALAAGELVRVARRRRGGQADLVEQRRDAPARARRRSPRPVDPQRLAEGLSRWSRAG